LCIQGHVLRHDDQIGGRIARPWGRTAAVGRPGLFSLSRLRMLCQPQPGVVHGITGLLAAARAARGSAQKVRIGPVEAESSARVKEAVISMEVDHTPINRIILNNIISPRHLRSECAAHMERKRLQALALEQ
jgi:hypothetical protein